MTRKYKREYDSWRSMRARCLNPNVWNYHNYGGKGIKVCKRWLYSFAYFLFDMGVRPVGTTLDRKESKGNYTLSNCRWATPKQQALNRRSSVVCFRGHRKQGRNLYLKPDGRRNCVICKRYYLRKWRERKMLLG